jgi:hypothetical protein
MNRVKEDKKTIKKIEIKKDIIRTLLRILRKSTKLRKNNRRKKKEEKLFCI